MLWVLQSILNSGLTKFVNSWWILLKALVLESANTLVLKEIPSPKPKIGEVLISVELASIGGSEYMGLANPGIRPLPHIMGHGIIGLTAENTKVAVYPLLGCANCEYCQSGLSQLCQDWSLIGVHSDGGFAQNVVVPQENLVNIPTSLSWEQTAFIEPFANSINAWELAHVESGQSVAIVGAGGLGLGLVACAKLSNTKTIAVTDLSTTRRNVASQLGATKVASELDGQFDIVFETYGSKDSRNQAIDLTKKGGKCIFMGFASKNLEVNISEVIRHQKHLLGSFVYSLSQFQEAIKLVELCSSEWVTNIMFSEVKPLLENYLKNDFSTVKAALRPNHA